MYLYEQFLIHCAQIYIYFLTHSSPLCCLPTVCGKFNTFSLHNLTDTRWPWHAAIYIRSPPDHTASTRRPRGIGMSIQQGASEESSFWYLACSGALLTQRSVLVAARCVLDKDGQRAVHPAHVKVVIGVQHQTSRHRMKSLHHLRVRQSSSQIKIHQMFYILAFIVIFIFLPWWCLESPTTKYHV